MFRYLICKWIGLWVLLSLVGCNSDNSTQKPASLFGKPASGIGYAPSQLLEEETESIELLLELMENRSKWQASDIQDFNYVLQKNCYCADSSRLQWHVVNGQAVAVKSLSGASIIGKNDMPATVEDLFQIIEKALASGNDQVSVTYHPQLGLPEFIYIDPDEKLLDDEVTYSVMDFAIGEEFWSNYYSSLALWRSFNISQYTFTLYKWCDCETEGEVTISIGDNSLATVAPAAESLSVPALFDLIRTYALQDQQIEVTYHKTLGYPLMIEVALSDVDDSTELYQVDNLQVIQPETAFQF